MVANRSYRFAIGVFVLLALIALWPCIAFAESGGLAAGSVVVPEGAQPSSDDDDYVVNWLGMPDDAIVYTDESSKVMYYARPNVGDDGNEDGTATIVWIRLSFFEGGPLDIPGTVMNGAGITYKVTALATEDKRAGQGNYPNRYYYLYGKSGWYRCDLLRGAKKDVDTNSFDYKYAKLWGWKRTADKSDARMDAKHIEGEVKSDAPADAFDDVPSLPRYLNGDGSSNPNIFHDGDQAVNRVQSRADTITSVTVPASVHEIGESVFQGLQASTVVFEGESALTTIGNRAFRGSKLTNIAIPNTVTSMGAVDNPNNQTPQGVFESCTSLETVTLPSNLEALAYSTFKYCTALKDIVFTDDSKLSTIYAYAFDNCSSLAQISKLVA